MNQIPLTDELFNKLGFTEYWAGCGDFGDRRLDLGTAIYDNPILKYRKEHPMYFVYSIDATEGGSYGGYEVESCPHHWASKGWEEMTTLRDMYEDVKRHRLPEEIARFVQLVKEKLNIEL